MLDNKGFDLWADGYDKAVGLSDEEKRYPFAGYKEVLGRIYQLVMVKGRAKVLDIGFGTGTLTAKLYEGGCEIWGQDFSERMIELAKAKMPGARLFQGDFSRGLAGPILSERYDFIIAPSSLHHLTDSEKISFINTLTGLLKEGGAILIGDVAFESRQELEQAIFRCHHAQQVESDTPPAPPVPPKASSARGRAFDAQARRAGQEPPASVVVRTDKSQE